MKTVKIKEAQTKRDVLQLIRMRFSPRSFKKDTLTKEEIHTLLEAASWAPSSMNEQPWRFVIALRSETMKFNRLTEYLMPGNRVWARNAGALLIILAKKTFSSDGRTNSSAAHDVGMASMNLLLQAVSMDIYGHLMGGFAKEKVSTELGLEDKDLEPITMLALGRLDHPEQLEEPFYTREITSRNRLPLDEIVLKLL